MTDKLCVGVVFGGQSAEHEVSLVSATSVIHALNPDKYTIVPIGITHEGKWLWHEHSLKMLKDGIKEIKNSAILAPDPNMKEILITKRENEELPMIIQQQKIDVFFPVLHGTYGEDGTIQGLFEMADVPYIGAGVLGSAVGMDKVIQKQVFQYNGLPTTKFLFFRIVKNPLKEKNGVQIIESQLQYPIFVKPANLGSSVGISKAHNRSELKQAIVEAFSFDNKIIVEQGIEPVREIEVSVLGNEEPIASLPGEVVPSREFYDYQAKYEDNQSKLEIPARLSENVIQKIQSIAIQAFQSIECSGMARVDFLLSGDQVYLSELNTIPGFTSISMYPKLWERSGISYPELLDKLIELALERHAKKRTLRKEAKLVSEWYKKE